MKRLFALALFAFVAALLVTQFSPAGFDPIALFASHSSLFGTGALAAGALIGLTMLDLARANCGDVERQVIEENINAVPELKIFPSEQLGAGELSYETLIRYALPTAGFTDMGGGFAPSNSKTRLERFETFPVGGRIEVPTRLADNWKRGGAAGYQLFESSGIALAAMIAIGQQIYGGRGLNGKGFPGLKNFTQWGGTYTDAATGKTYNITTDALGTTATTGSSVYFVKFGPTAVQLEFGTGSVFTLPDFRIESIIDPTDATKKIKVYVSDLEGMAGLQIASPHAVRRITNLTADAGKGMTDLLANTVLANFPVGWAPDAILMSRRSCTQLQNTRTVTLFGSAAGSPKNQGLIAPRPTEINGIPIIETDCIPDNDAIEIAAAPNE